MQLKYIQKNYLKYNLGKGFISGHVDALHAKPPDADLFTDDIVENLIKNTGCAGIISTVSRKKMDLNRSPNGKNVEGIKEYCNAIEEIIDFLGILDNSTNTITKPYLHMSFHGMKDLHYGPYAIEIGTLKGRSCSPDVRQWMKEMLAIKVQEISPHIELLFDEKFVGNKSISYHRWGDGKFYKGYKQNFHTFQIEISHTLRSKYWYEICEIFSYIMNEFQTKYVHPKN